MQILAFVAQNAYTLLFVAVAGTASLLCGKAILTAWAKRRRRRKWAKQQSDIRALWALDCWEFEVLVGEVFRELGYRVKDTGGGGADGGIDHIVQKDGRTDLVQTKHYRTKSVGAGVIRELAGVVMREKAHGGIVVTVGKFTKAARKEAACLPIGLIDGPALVQLKTKCLR
jgi:restriction system protein